MIKKLFLLSSILTISACASNESKQCDPAKNYIISSPEAIEEFKNLQKNNKIKSYYYEKTPNDICNNNRCVSFDFNKYEFVEQYFNDKYRKGVYTIKISNDINNKDCLPTDPFNINKKYCYIVTKNKDNKIFSTYSFITNSTKKYKTIEMKNKNTLLFKVSYEIYSTGAVGGPGFGICPQNYINNPEYKFNPLKVL